MTNVEGLGQVRQGWRESIRTRAIQVLPPAQVPRWKLATLRRGATDGSMRREVLPLHADAMNVGERPAVVAGNGDGPASQQQDENQKELG